MGRCYTRWRFSQEGILLTKPRGGWNGRSKARPASEQDIRYGHGVVRRESAAWPEYFIVTTPSAHKVTGPHLARGPAGVGYVRGLDWGHLQQVTEEAPAGVELVVGIGGGTALDASKYVALKKGLPLVLVPTIISSGAIIHGVFAKWDGRRTIGTDWPWIDCEHILVDYDITLQAPYYLNTAGLGDVLCAYAGMAEWRRGARTGNGPPFDEDAAAPVIEHHRQIEQGFPKTLADTGALTAESIRFIMEAVQERDSTAINNPAAPGADHTLWLCMEDINNRGWVHGEAVALAAVVIAWHCDEDPGSLIARLDACKVRWRPPDIDVGRDELRKGLEFAPTCMSEESSARGVSSILRAEPITGRRFDDLWEFLSSA